MALSDSLTENYAVTLQDINGITISGTNYKINSGNKISLDVTKFSMELPTVVNFRQRNNRALTSATEYSDLISEHTFSGIENLKIVISGILWFDTIDSPNNGKGSPLTLQILNDIRVFNHTLYLKDYQGSSTSVVTPIQSLCTKADLLSNTVGTVNGLPVVVTKISNINRGNDDIRGAFITYTLELEEDKV
jgi:hypothetical protein